MSSTSRPQGGPSPRLRSEGVATTRVRPQTTSNYRNTVGDALFISGLDSRTITATGTNNTNTANYDNNIGGSSVSSRGLPPQPPTSGGGRAPPTRIPPPAQGRGSGAASGPPLQRPPSAPTTATAVRRSSSWKDMKELVDTGPGSAFGAPLHGFATTTTTTTSGPSPGSLSSVPSPSPQAGWPASHPSTRSDETKTTAPGPHRWHHYPSSRVSPYDLPPHDIRVCDGHHPPNQRPTENRKPPPQPPIRTARPALESPSRSGIQAGSESGRSNNNDHGSGAVTANGSAVRRRSADFSALKNQIADSLDEIPSKEKEARGEQGGESGVVVPAGQGSGINSTGKLQHFGKNLLGRAKKFTGSRGKDNAANDDDDNNSSSECDDSRIATSPTGAGSFDNLRTILSSAPDQGSGVGRPDPGRPMSFFPPPQTATLARPMSSFSKSSGGSGGSGPSGASFPAKRLPFESSSVIATGSVLAPCASASAGVSVLPNSTSNETPHERRTKIANELLETERSYISSLCTLIDVYQASLLAFVRESAPPEMADVAMRVTQIFPAILQLIPFNRELLSRLESVMSNWNESSTIGNIFVEMAPFLKMYKDYENSYSQTLDNYTEMLKDASFRSLIDQLDSDPRVQSSRLESIIIMPIQRIPRYKLLLEDLLKRTPESHPDNQLLKDALKKVDEVAVFLDANLKEHEQRQKVVELTVNFNANSLLQPHRKWLREGEVGLRDPNLGNRVKKLRILLFNDILVPTVLSKLGVGGENRRDVLNRPENQWPLDLLWLSEPDLSIGTEKDNKGKSLQLELTGPGTNYYLIFKTPEEKESWKKDIIEAQERHTRGGPNASLGDKRIGQYVFKNSTFYRGEWLRGQVHGKGEMVQHGNIYTGNFAYDLKCGLGRMIFATKEVYDGDWANDLPHGQGTMMYPAGDQYEGGWNAGQRHGHGVLTYENTDVYAGSWEDNMPSGQGTLTCANGLHYEGYWRRGEFHGQGTLTTPTGKCYIGEWSQGQRSGRGVMRYHKDSVFVEEYEGEWVEDMKHGHGEWKSVEGVYIGQFMYNYREGEGTMRYADGSIYTGSWKKDKRHGIGTYEAGTSKSRIRKYEGEWAFGKKNGKGHIWFTNGNQYEGTFKRDQIHGNGTMMSFVNGAKLEGKWVHGHRIGNAKLTFKPTGEESKELNGVCKEPMLELRKMRYTLAPILPVLNNIDVSLD